jgi:hypothetical protein
MASRKWRPSAYEKLALGERGAMSHNWVLGGIIASGLAAMVPAAAGAGDAGWRNERLRAIFSPNEAAPLPVDRSGK